MPTGYLDANGDPYITVEVSNPLNWKVSLNCLIDTGFTGFLSIPILQAFPIGLLLITTIPVTLADGRTDAKLGCLGRIHLGGESQVGLIIIEPSSTQPLLGMEFLRKFNKRLIVDPLQNVVELTDSLIVHPPS